MQFQDPRHSFCLFYQMIVQIQILMTPCFVFFSKFKGCQYFMFHNRGQLIFYPYVDRISFWKINLSAIPSSSEEGEAINGCPPCYNTKLYMICFTECMQHGCFFSLLIFWIKNRTRKQQHIYSTTNQPGTILFFKNSQNISCMLSNYQKRERKRKNTQHVNYCTRERLEVCVNAIVLPRYRTCIQR